MSRRWRADTKTGLAVAVLALAAFVAGLVLLLGPDGGEPAETVERTTQLEDVVPAALWRGCRYDREDPRPRAIATANCSIRAGSARPAGPDALELSLFATAKALRETYEAERARYRVRPAGGTCNGKNWMGEGTWGHAGGPPDGRRFCIEEATDALLVWMREQVAPGDGHVLGVARKHEAKHAALLTWWTSWRDRIGRAR